jgi:hypothetical protein
MRKLICILMLGMSGCAWYNSVETEYVYPCSYYMDSEGHNIKPECLRKPYWKCKALRPIFFVDYNLAVCDTKEECTRVCRETK